MYKIFVKQIKYVIIKLKKDITSYNFKESNNNNGIKRFANNSYFFDLIDSKLKKARLYGSKRRIN